MQVGAASDIGRVRGRNEDALLVDDDHNFFVVADGLGGHPAGDVASRTAVETLDRHLDDLSRGDPADALVSALRAADDAIRSEAATDQRRAGMATTAVVARVTDGGEEAWVAHVGDSRAYLVREADLRRITRDHTTGGLFGRGSITQALGTGDGIDPDVTHIDLVPGDRLLLCTDGLTDMVPEDAIAKIAAAPDDPQAACQRLVDAANERGGVDNITVIVVEV
ncbi:MAG: protein phosphatase 2C domain-containing protein [Actinobacteria bacterium]|nr:protein phosphatase 2C domain-containing protein [Actinomycetota bacterium]